MNCILCGEFAVVSCGLTRQQRPFWHCKTCDLIFIDPSALPNPQDETARYQQHQNTDSNSGYQDFLRRLTNPLRPHLREGMSAIDYGSGPSPTLSQILQHDYSDKIVTTKYFDPLFFPDWPAQQFDLVTASEVIEHFHAPRQEFTKLLSLAKSSGLVAVMTQFHQGPEHLRTWWYANDITHVCFYSQQTMRWIAQNFGLQILDLQPNGVTIFCCPSSSSTSVH